MKRSYILILIALIIVFFIFISNAILSIKILELKVLLTKSQLMNYEFSSEILKKKFKTILDARENYKAEIETSAMESSVLNFESEEKKLKMNSEQKIGLLIVNIIRKLSLKDFIYLEDDQSVLLKLQYAFLLERNQRYANAAEKYSELEKTLLKGLKEDRAFVLLHNGYVTALMGDTPKSIIKLEEVLDQYPGTHFSNSARILIDILNETNRRTKSILTNENIDLAEKLFNTGQFALVLIELKKKTSLTLMERYMRARSNEKVGNIKIATPEYVELATQKEDINVATLANRRLLMFGNVYGGDKKIAKKAEETATALGDTTIVDEIVEGAKKQLSSIIIEKINKNPENIPSDLKEIKEEIVKELPSLNTTPKKEPEVPVEKKIIKNIIADRQKIAIELIDGRKVYGDNIDIENYKMNIQSGSLKTAIPKIMVKKITLKYPFNKKTARKFLDISIKDNKYFPIKEIQFNDNEITLIDNKDQIFSTAIIDLSKIRLRIEF